MKVSNTEYDEHKGRIAIGSMHHMHATRTAALHGSHGINFLRLCMFLHDDVKIN